ncbi:MAG: hypothetical protein ACR2OD_11300 [Gaiellaceae bacterium]
MATTQQTAHRTFGTPVTTSRPDSDWTRRTSRQALIGALCIALLGAVAYGIFAAANGGDTTGATQASIHRASQDTAHLNAKAEAFRSGAFTPRPTPSPRALEAYGERWTALGSSLAPTAVSAEALAAYGGRWTALAEGVGTQSPSAGTIDAYGARWAALADLYPVS